MVGLIWFEEPRRGYVCIETAKPRAFLLLLYAAQVGQAFLGASPWGPAPQRTPARRGPYLCRTRYTDWGNALVARLGFRQRVGGSFLPGRQNLDEDVEQHEGNDQQEGRDEEAFLPQQLQLVDG